MSRISDPSLLRPDFADRHAQLTAYIHTAGLPLATYESIRSPVRQNELYLIGRDPDKVGFGRTVTNARAYQSAHQYGLAVDFAFFVDGAWTWNEPETGAWLVFGELVLKAGLHQLHDRSGHLIEKSHCQIMPFDLNSLQSGPPDTADWIAWLRKRNGA